MKKIGVTILSLFALSVLSTGAAIGIEKTNVSAETLSYETQQTLFASPNNNGLVAPRTYEEYLQLSSPACVAVCENYTAIADGNVLYVYNRAAGVYQTYTHGQGRAEDLIKNMQFYNGNLLFFADNGPGANLYQLNVSTLDSASKIDDIACGTFLIAENDLYFTNAAGTLYTATLADVQDGLPNNSLTSLQWENVSSLAYYNNELYFIHSNLYLHKINPRTFTGVDAEQSFLSPLSQQVSSMTVCEGAIAYTTVEGGFYSYLLADISDNGLQYKAQDTGYTDVYPLGKSVFLMQNSGGIVKEYSTERKAFTAYEISSNSPANHRLSHATDMTLYKNGKSIYSVDRMKPDFYTQCMSACEAIPSAVVLTSDEYHNSQFMDDKLHNMPTLDLFPPDTVEVTEEGYVNNLYDGYDPIREQARINELYDLVSRKMNLDNEGNSGWGAFDSSVSFSEFAGDEAYRDTEEWEGRAAGFEHFKKAACYGAEQFHPEEVDMTDRSIDYVISRAYKRAGYAPEPEQEAPIHEPGVQDR